MEDVKQRFEELVRNNGFENVHQLSVATKIDMSNIYSNLKGSWKMSLPRMFKIANALRVPITSIIELFYPDEYWENVKKVEEANQEQMDKLFS